MTPEEIAHALAVLRCDNCYRVSDEHAAGWAAGHAREDDDRVVIVVMCPECWADIEAPAHGTG